MDRLFLSIADFSDSRVGGGDSFCDRLNNRYTVLLLVIFSALLTTKIYVGEPISCFCPAEFTHSHVDFANAVCWVQNTYYLPVSTRHIPKPGEKRDYIGNQRHQKTPKTPKTPKHQRHQSTKDTKDIKAPKTPKHQRHQSTKDTKAPKTPKHQRRQRRQRHQSTKDTKAPKTPKTPKHQSTKAPKTTKTRLARMAP